MNNTKILGAIGQDTQFEKNVRVPDSDNDYISQDADDSGLNTYRKSVTISGRVPDAENPSITRQTIVVTRTLLGTI